MAHKKYTVKQGDCISSIAFEHGFFPDTIWNDPENSELKEKREDPNVLLPGDVVYIKDKEIKEESCASDQRHRFRRKGVPEILRIQFKINDEPRANEAYVLEIDGSRSEGKSDGDGVVEVWIPPSAMSGKISFPDGEDEYELELGDLDPITEISGLQARLRNLGFYDGEVDGEESEELEQAIRVIQERHDLEPTGELDETTRDKILEEHGG
ncbi:MAG TPA: peptidoglycan-binding protein [Acidobacteriota bacterium]|nr:peptidoglycan-binding protein [Acidobacteriota bacterium]